MNFEFSDTVKALKPSAIREILKLSSLPGMIPFSAGNPAPEAFPVKEVQEISEKLLREHPIDALQYSVTEGYMPLKKTLIDYHVKKYGFTTDNHDCLITSGAQQANALAARVLLNKGDTIVCENPSFIGSLNAFRSYGFKLCGVEMERDGVDIDALEKAFNKTGAKMFYTIPNFQNPSGITMSLEKRKKVLELAEKYNVIILEDNPYGELRFSGEDILPIKSFDKSGRVVYVGSFSKVLSPGMRVGYAYADTEILKKMIVCKQTSDVHTNIWAQHVCHEFMTNYDYAGHIGKIQAIYRKKANLCMDLCKTHLSPDISFQKVEGGLFLWCRIENGKDMVGFCKYAVENGVATVPGTAFLCDESDKTNYFRINYSTPTDEQIEQGIAKLGTLIREF